MFIRQEPDLHHNNSIGRILRQSHQHRKRRNPSISIESCEIPPGAMGWILNNEYRFPYNSLIPDELSKRNRAIRRPSG